jgi:hypothetical protein
MHPVRFSNHNSVRPPINLEANRTRFSALHRVNPPEDRGVYPHITLDAGVCVKADFPMNARSPFPPINVRMTPIWHDIPKVTT